jgi:hypothetical protein
VVPSLQVLQPKLCMHSYSVYYYKHSFITYKPICVLIFIDILHNYFYYFIVVNMILIIQCSNLRDRGECLHKPMAPRIPHPPVLSSAKSMREWTSFRKHLTAVSQSPEYSHCRSERTRTLPHSNGNLGSRFSLHSRI